MKLVAVTDTGPLIHLGEIDSIRLLSIFDRLYVPETVRVELEAGGIPEELAELDHAVVGADVDSVDNDDLDPGETAAVAIAEGRDAVLLTDDLAAREYAVERGIEVHGSLGIIVLGYSRGWLEGEAAVALIRTLQRETSLFVTNAVVERGIELLDER